MPDITLKEKIEKMVCGAACSCPCDCKKGCIPDKLYELFLEYLGKENPK